MIAYSSEMLLVMYQKLEKLVYIHTRNEEAQGYCRGAIVADTSIVWRGGGMRLLMMQLQAVQWCYNTGRSGRGGALAAVKQSLGGSQGNMGMARPCRESQARPGPTAIGLSLGACSRLAYRLRASVCVLL